MAPELDTSLHIADPDGFYQRLIELHEGLTPEESQQVNARLILLLANQVGGSRSPQRDPGASAARESLSAGVASRWYLAQKNERVRSARPLKAQGCGTAPACRSVLILQLKSKLVLRAVKFNGLTVDDLRSVLKARRSLNRRLVEYSSRTSF